MLSLGRVTVLIGANGSGKSNILEAIAFAAGAAANKLDNEFLFNRGIRVTEKEWVTSAFPPEDSSSEKQDGAIELSVIGSEVESAFECRVKPLNSSQDGELSGWDVQPKFDSILLPDVEVLDALEKNIELAQETWGENKRETKKTIEKLRQFRERVRELREIDIRRRKSKIESAREFGLLDFLIYAPENTVLRTPPPESAIQPLGTRGEGLLRLLQSFTDEKHQDRLAELKARLRLVGWFDDFKLPDEADTASARLRIHDKWLAEDRAFFDQRSANEGFLYLLFYFTLLISWRTPRFFALDNVDNGLNPRLCTAVMANIVELATKYGKQVICTTHNPAILDGLDLQNDQQRLYAVRRDSEGRTVVRRIHAPKPQVGEAPIRLSEAFVRGILGGLPDHF